MGGIPVEKGFKHSVLVCNMCTCLLPKCFHIFTSLYFCNVLHCTMCESAWHCNCLLPKLFPRLMCSQSTLGTARHMEDNFGLDFLRHNFHISCFDFPHISSWGWFSNLGALHNMLISTSTLEVFRTLCCHCVISLYILYRTLCAKSKFLPLHIWGTTLERLLCGSFRGWI